MLLALKAAALGPTKDRFHRPRSIVNIYLGQQSDQLGTVLRTYGSIKHGQKSRIEKALVHRHA